MDSGDGSRSLPSRTSSAVPLWILLAAVAALIRAIRLDHFSFWLDEILETYTIRDSWPNLWRSLHWQGLHAPLDYVFRKPLEYLQPSDAIRRIPSVLWGALSVPLFGWLLARRGGRTFGLCGAGLLALAPYHVRYSQEVRPYALGMLLLVASVLALDTYLDRPGILRLAVLYGACLATLYTLYVAGLVLALATASLLVEDAFDEDSRRRSATRRFLIWSPVFAAAIAVGYLPWWPTLIRAMRSSPMTTAPALSIRRLGRYISYFGFGPRDAVPLQLSDAIFLGAMVFGFIAAWRTPRLRFLLPWGIGGVALLELLEQQHPTYDSIFHWLPAGLGLTAIAALGVSRILEARVSVAGRAAAILLIFLLSLQGLSSYFREGRPDWRPLARFLAVTPASERIFVENQYTQLCVGYYLVGPDWLCCKKLTQREVANLDGNLSRLLQAWDRSRDSWLVLAAGPRSEALRSWAARFPAIAFPTAEGESGAIVRHLLRGVP
jgi:hypothetical protein